MFESINEMAKNIVDNSLMRTMIVSLFGIA